MFKRVFTLSVLALQLGAVCAAAPVRHATVRGVKDGAPVLPLPKHAKALGNIKFTSGGKSYDLVDFMALDRVTGMLVLKSGEIAYDAAQKPDGFQVCPPQMG